MYCPRCDIDMTSDMEHCEDCNICVYGFDHHCVFFSKCIGGGNIICFFGAIAMLIINFLLVSIFFVMN